MRTADRPPPSPVERDRRAYRRRQNTRSVLISVASTILFALLLGFAVVGSPGWPAVQRSFFNLEIGVEFFPRILQGLWLNVRVLFFAVIGVAVLGSLLAVARTLRGAVWTPIRLLSAGYTDVFRGLPVLLVLYLVGFGIPGSTSFRGFPRISGARSLWCCATPRT